MRQLPWIKIRRNFRNEKGSLALEQVLFIGAIVAMSAGVWTFYDNIKGYFDGFTVTNSPTDFGKHPS